MRNDGQTKRDAHTFLAVADFRFLRLLRLRQATQPAASDSWEKATTPQPFVLGRLDFTIELP
jgi:hypothetical protein